MKYERRMKKGRSGREIINEPVRRSISDVVETNLKTANRVTFLHRLIYVGQYYFKDNKNMVEIMEKNYKQSNSGYCTEPLSGVLVYYPQHFCYIVEASESILNKHLTLLFEQNEGCLINVKLLAAVHHVKGRFWNEWMSYYGRPPQRIEEIDSESNMENSMRYIKECCEKLYKFANAFIADQLKLRNKYLDAQTGDDDGTEENESVGLEVTTGLRMKSIAERDPYNDYLPEVKLLDFLINCKHCKDLKQYHRYYEYIGQSIDYSLKVWPTPRTIIPYDVFDKPYCPVEDLPIRESAEKEEEAFDTESEASKQD